MKQNVPCGICLCNQLIAVAKARAIGDSQPDNAQLNDNDLTENDPVSRWDRRCQPHLRSDGQELWLCFW